ncbi:hypothetical protein ACS0TY_016891 [Phlomoides rotata]
MSRGIRSEDLELFNMALMGKWMWRWLNKKESLWVKVVESKCGYRRGEELILSIMRGSGRWSGWWKDVVKITLGERGDWFRDRLARVVGSGKSISFWEDIWVGWEGLKEKFPRLYHLILDKEGRVGDMGRWEGRSWRWIWRWRWRWRRGLFEREIDTFNLLVSLVNMSHLKEGIKDNWKWRGGD